MNKPRHNLTHETAIFNLWLNWVVACGALVLPNLISVYVVPIIVPLAVLVIAGLLAFYNRSSLQSGTAVCPLIPTISMRSLLMSGLIMLVIMLIYSKGLIYRFFHAEVINSQQPFITALIISPVVLFNTLWATFRGERYEACRKCRVMLGTRTERGFIGDLYAQESKYQRWFLLSISACLTLVSWTYYALFYINVNINIPDKFFFGWVPVIFYLISVVYLVTRYFTVWAYYYQTMESDARHSGRSTAVRFMVICGDSIYLSRQEEFCDIPDATLFDTPALLAFSHRDKMTSEEARLLFGHISQIEQDKFDLRFMYYSQDSSTQHNMFHYICCLHDKDVVKGSLLEGQWFNLPQLDRMLHNREVAPMLASEIRRLYTVTMAWKTYDISGNRLYKVKNYRPVFRLNGICDWDVDFNSPVWLRVWQFNEDKPFFKLRRFFRRLGGNRQ